MVPIRGPPPHRPDRESTTTERPPLRTETTQDRHQQQRRPPARETANLGPRPSPPHQSESGGGGPSVCALIHPSIVSVVAWLPPVLSALERGEKRPRGRALRGSAQLREPLASAKRSRIIPWESGGVAEGVSKNHCRCALDTTPLRDGDLLCGAGGRGQLGGGRERCNNREKERNRLSPRQQREPGRSPRKLAFHVAL